MAEQRPDFQQHLNAYLQRGAEALAEGRAELRSWGPAVGSQVWPGSSIREVSGTGYPDGGVAFTDAKLTVTKASGWMMVSDEVAMDAGVIPDTRPRAPWHRRAKWRLQRWRERAAKRAYRVICGSWPPEEEAYWDE
jgi:hypothetical protein